MAIMISYISVIIFHLFISFIQANDDRNFYTVVSAGDTLTNVEEVQIDKLGAQQDSVQVKLYYESLCPGCRQFVTTQFAKTVQVLHPYLDIAVYPYGNAQTKIVNGKYVFTCQHGPAECYGNMLHACAIDYLQNLTLAISYNTCMMAKNGTGSDDNAATECGVSMKIDSMTIKACANGDRGSYLLNYYGQASKEAGYNYVPYVLINGKEFQQDVAFMTAVCAAFQNPPPPCKNNTSPTYTYTVTPCTNNNEKIGS